jgi:two-component system, NarL family, nitrate/nitrite response regulator NarL
MFPVQRPDEEDRSPSSEPGASPLEGARTTGVLVVCDLQLHADAVAQALEQHPTGMVAWAASDQVTAVQRAVEGAAALDRIVIVFEAITRGALTSVRVFTRCVPGAALIALGITEREFESFAQAGVRAHMPPAASLDDLVETIGALERGQTREPSGPVVVRRAAAPRLAALTVNGREPELTLRELEVVSLITEGLTNAEIGHRLNIELATVKNHVHNVFAKLGIKRRAQAAAWFRQRSSG